MRTSARVAPATMVAGMLAVTGCAYNPSSADVYPAYEAQREATVRMATIESVRAVTISSNNGQPSGLGAVGGGAVGAVAGSTIGGGTGSIVTGILGGIVGAVAGNTVENAAANRKGVEITVRLDNGDFRAITQAAGDEIFRAGERVRLVSTGGVTRVTH
ncbi:MAG TPA: glycine zipper 2TM domain-containing protein [Trinickia sp.]|jgi:outer membrane lipoprotein SlyB|uniref:glycine zipper 2TM domain-containing protein n=1 Tax=Trinickia sp. TaxID=2571163 RepID=UPI002BC60FBC|nr:glycine zipper 2TM domain-containing protein [Trinickia sp.]HTI16916.1 glycine zipper 2TM domain-containing protein [Trinickia sp.]